VGRCVCPLLGERGPGLVLGFGARRRGPFASSLPTRKRTRETNLSPQLLGAVSVRKFVSATPGTPPRLGETSATQPLSLGGNGCRAPPATRPAAGAGGAGRRVGGEGGRNGLHCACAHTHTPLTPEGRKTPALPENLPPPQSAPRWTCR